MMTVLNVFSVLLGTLALLLALGVRAWQAPVLGTIGAVGALFPGWTTLIGTLAAAVTAVTMMLSPSWWLAAPLAAGLGAIATGRRVIADQRAVLREAGVSVSARDFFRPFAMGAATADEVTTYGPCDGRSPGMAVFRPVATADGAPAPVVVHVHGGGWNSGNERSDAAFCRHLADNGFLVFSITYTHAAAELPTWEIAQREVLTALAEVRSLAAQYGGDGAAVGLTGGSAGVNLALLAALRVSRGETLGVTGPFPRITGVAANIPAVDPGMVYGNPFWLTGPLTRRLVETYTGGTPEEYPGRYDAVNPTPLLHAAAPPVLFLMGAHDQIAPGMGTLPFQQRARFLGVGVTTVTVPWVGHTMSASSAVARLVCEVSATWLADRATAFGEAPSDLLTSAPSTARTHPWTLSTPSSRVVSTTALSSTPSTPSPATAR